MDFAKVASRLNEINCYGSYYNVSIITDPISIDPGATRLLPPYDNYVYMQQRNNPVPVHGTIYFWKDCLQKIKDSMHTLLSEIHTNYCELAPITFRKGLAKFDAHFIILGPLKYSDKNKLWQNAHSFSGIEDWEIKKSPKRQNMRDFYEIID